MIEGWRRAREPARGEHLPALAGCGDRVEPLPGARRETLGQTAERPAIDQRLRGDDELGMAAGDVETVDDVRVVVLIADHAGGRHGAEPEMETALPAVVPGLHPGFHDDLADRGFVGELRHVADGVRHD